MLRVEHQAVEGTLPEQLNYCRVGRLDKTPNQQFACCEALL
jgi:hypothetical protein